MTKNSILLTGIIISIILLLYAGQKAPGITFDSRNFLYAGQSLSERGIFVREQNKPFTEYAPLYALLLATLNLFSADMLQAIVVFQAILLAAGLWWLGTICYSFFENRLIFTVFLMALAFGSPLLLVYHFVWAESIFVFFAIAVFCFLWRYRQNGALLDLAGLVLSGILLCMSRFAGVLFLPALFFILCYFESKKKVPFPVLKAGCCTALMAIPLLIFWIYNTQLHNYSFIHTSNRLQAVSLDSLFVQTSDIVTSWLLPDELPLWLRVSVLVLPILFLLKISSSLNPAFFVSSVFTIGYLLLVIPAVWYVKSYIYAQEVIDDRILAPVYHFGMLSFFLLTDNLYKKIPKNLQKTMFFILFCWLIYPATRGINNIVFWHEVSKPERVFLVKF